MGNSNTTIKQTVDEFRKDDDGNIIGCPKCGARNIRKDGFHYRKDIKKQQWQCNSCGRKTLNPVIVEPSPFKVVLPEVPTSKKPLALMSPAAQIKSQTL